MRQIDSRERSTQQKSYVINLSKHELSDDENNALKKGLNFAVVPTSIPKTNLITGVESAIRGYKTINDEEAEKTRAAVASVIRHAKPPKLDMPKGEIDALTELRNNEEVVILQADKGNATVILDAEDYEQKAAAIL